MGILNTPLIVENAVAGIAAGIMVSIILGIYRKYIAHIQRQGQIRYVKKLILDRIDRIRKSNNDKERFLYYNRLLRVLVEYLGTEKSSRITAAEKQALENLMPYEGDGSIAFLTVPPEDKKPDEYFDQAIDQFRGNANYRPLDIIFPKS